MVNDTTYTTDIYSTYLISGMGVPWVKDHTNLVRDSDTEVPSFVPEGVTVSLPSSVTVNIVVTRVHRKGTVCIGWRNRWGLFSRIGNNLWCNVTPRLFCSLSQIFRNFDFWAKSVFSSTSVFWMLYRKCSGGDRNRRGREILPRLWTTTTLLQSINYK